MYQQLQAQPSNQSVPDEWLAKEWAVLTAFMQYLVSSGSVATAIANIFERINIP
jgi:hypothetical protein